MHLLWMLFAIALGVSFGWLCLAAVLWLAEVAGGWAATGVVVVVAVVAVAGLVVLG